MLSVYLQAEATRDSDKLYDAVSFVAKPYQSSEPLGKQKKDFDGVLLPGNFSIQQAFRAKLKNIFVLNVHR